MWENPYDFGLWFYNSLIQPLLDICKDTSILGFSLFTWLLSIAFIALAVRVVRALFSSKE